MGGQAHEKPREIFLVFLRKLRREKMFDCLFCGVLELLFCFVLKCFICFVPRWKALSCDIRAKQEFRNWFALRNRQINHKKQYCLPLKATYQQKVRWNLRRNGRWDCSLQLWYGLLREKISFYCLLYWWHFPATGVLN